MSGDLSLDLMALFRAFNEVAAVLLPLFSAAGVLMGLYLIASAAVLMVKGDRSSGADMVPIGKIAIRSLIGAMFLQFAVSVDWALEMTGGVGSGARSYLMSAAPASGTGSAFWAALVGAGMLWVAVVGVAGIFKGLLLWSKAGDGDQVGAGGQQDYGWRGLWHVLGGAVCVNIGS